MKNFVLLSLLAISLFAGSCSKTIGTPFAYSIDTFSNVYVNNNDSLLFSVPVKYLAGNDKEVVKVTISGLPSHVWLSQDTLSGTGNFSANFLIHADSAIIGNYPVNLVSYSSSNGYRIFTFNLGIVHNNCSSYLTGNFSGNNACSATGSYPYASTVTAIDASTISISNLGGYGVYTNAIVQLNCNTDSVYIASQNIGNGVTLSGHGHFTASQIIITYSALNIPGGGNDNCTAVLSR